MLGKTFTGSFPTTGLFSLHSEEDMFIETVIIIDGSDIGDWIAKSKREKSWSIPVCALNGECHRASNELNH